jgi:hypothetical protein
MLMEFDGSSRYLLISEKMSDQSCPKLIAKAVGLVGADQGVAAASERGCVALEDIRAGELLLEIPVSCCLSVIPGLEHLEPQTFEMDVSTLILIHMLHNTYIYIHTYVIITI